MQKLKAFFGCILFLCGAMLLFGCDKRPSRVPVSGQVLIDGKPLKFGQVLFIPEGGRQATGKLNSEGKFSLTCSELNDGTIVGNQRVAVLAGETISQTKVFWHAPDKYADFNTSGIERKITEKTDNLVIELTWKNNPPGHAYMKVEGADSGDVMPQSRKKQQSPKAESSSK